MAAAAAAAKACAAAEPTAGGVGAGRSGATAFCIAADRVLRAIAAARPQTLGALRRVKGVGKKTMEHRRKQAEKEHAATQAAASLGPNNAKMCRLCKKWTVSLYSER